MTIDKIGRIIVWAAILINGIGEMNE